MKYLRTTYVQHAPRLSPGAYSWESPLTLFGKLYRRRRRWAHAAKSRPSTSVHTYGSLSILLGRGAALARGAVRGQVPESVKRGAPDPRSGAVALASHQKDRLSRLRVAATGMRRARRPLRIVPRGACRCRRLSSEVRVELSPWFVKGYPYVLLERRRSPPTGDRSFSWKAARPRQAPWNLLVCKPAAVGGGPNPTQRWPH